MAEHRDTSKGKAPAHEAGGRRAGASAAAALEMQVVDGAGEPTHIRHLPWAERGLHTAYPLTSCL